MCIYIYREREIRDARAEREPQLSLAGFGHPDAKRAASGRDRYIDR